MTPHVRLPQCLFSNVVVITITFARRRKCIDARLALEARRHDPNLASLADVGVCAAFPTDVLSIDHCFDLGSDFGGKWSLTCCNSIKQVLSMIIVDSTSWDHILRMLTEIGQRPKVRGRRFLLLLDNLPHSGWSDQVEKLVQASGAEGAVQDLFHVYKSADEGLNNTHVYYKSGQVCMLPVCFFTCLFHVSCTATSTCFPCRPSKSSGMRPLSIRQRR